MAHNPFIAVIHNRFRQALAQIHHHRWIKGCRVLKGVQADEELVEWVLLDLLDQFCIREPETGLDDQSTQCYAKGFCPCSKALAELCRAVIPPLLPRNEHSQLDSAIVTRKFHAKRQEEVFERETMTISFGTCGKLRTAFRLKTARSRRSFRQKS